MADPAPTNAWRETKLAYAAILSDPGRLIRFGGVPMLLSVLAVLAAVVRHPMPGLADPAELEAWSQATLGYFGIAGLLGFWAYGRMAVRWFRWTLRGDDETGFLDVGLSGVELKTLLWAVVSVLAAIPAFVFLMIAAAVLSLVGAIAFAIPGGEAGAAAGAIVGGQLGAAVGLLGVFYVMGRLLPGVVPVSFGQEAALGAAWRGIQPVGGRAMFTLWLISLPSMLAGLPLALAPLFGESMPTPIYVLVTAIGFPVNAATAVALARLWQAEGSRGLTPVAPMA